MICRSNSLSIVFHHDNSVTRVTKTFDQIKKSTGILRVQPDSGFIKDIESFNQSGTQRVRKVDPLSLSARKRSSLPG